MATAPKRPTYTSPAGTFKYPSLSTPDFGNEKFPKPDGEFKVNVIVPAAEAQPLIDKLTPLWQQAIEEAKALYAAMPIAARKKAGPMKEQMFYEEEYDNETEEPTGNVIFKFKTKYKIVDKKTKAVRFNKIGIFDAAKQSMELRDADTGKLSGKYPAIYGGTVGKVAFQTNPYWVAGQVMAGLSLRLSAVQIIDLVGPGARSADSYGFGEEDGFTADPDAVASSESSSTPFDGAPASTNGDQEDF